MIEIEISNQQAALDVDESRLSEAARDVLQLEGAGAAHLSIAIVDDATIHELNRRYLQHDYATDVLSFPLGGGGDAVEGEIIVSADTAARSAPQYGWPAGDELLLYVIHGTLHLIGYEDTTPNRRAEMRQREQIHLKRYGLKPRYDEDDTS